MKVFYLFMIYTAVLFQTVFGEGASMLSWQDVRKIDNCKMLANAHYIDGFRLIPAMNEVSPLANCLAQILRHNEVNVSSEVENYFEKFCHDYGIGADLKKAMTEAVLNPFYRGLEKAQASAESDISAICRSYESKNFPKYGRRWLQAGERSTLVALYFLKQCKENISSNVTVKNLLEGLDKYCNEYYLEANCTSDVEFNLEKVKGFLLKDRPVIMVNESESLVACGFIDNDKILIYNPQAAEIAKRNGSEIYIKALEHKYDPDSNTLRKLNTDWYYEYVVSSEAERSPIMVPPIALQVVSAKSLLNGRYQCVYGDNFKVQTELIKKLDHDLKDFLVNYKGDK